MTRSTAVVLSCEHASASVPASLRPRFAGAQRVLASHRGHDRGALELARRLRRALGPGVPLVAARVSRLVVDANRSLGGPGLFSPWTADLPEPRRLELLRRHWSPHRERVRRAVEAGLGGGPVLHLGVHSFTPVLRGRRRELDVGLLFDPARAGERELCTRWARVLRRSGLVVRLNQPYRGTDDGLTTTLRTEFSPADYLGIELELNQRFPRGAGPAWQELQRTLAASLVSCTGG